VFMRWGCGWESWEMISNKLNYCILCLWRGKYIVVMECWFVNFWHFTYSTYRLIMGHRLSHPEEISAAHFPPVMTIFPEKKQSNTTGQLSGL
jgi:hypothetical protein